MFRTAAVVCVLLLGAGCAPRPASSSDGRATVARVIDGDTIVVRIAGHDENVRLLGIDAPETHKPDTPVECFGPEASDRLKALLPTGAAVRLARGAGTRGPSGRPR